MTKPRGLLVGCCAALTLWCSTAHAVVCVVPEAGGTAQMPPTCPSGYQSPEDVHLIIDGLPPGTVILVDASHERFNLTGSGPGGSLGGQFEQFGSHVMMQMNGTGALAGFNRFIDMQAFCETHIGPRTLGQPVQSFDTAMFAMQGQIPIGDPDFDLLRITAGNAFGMPSPGHTTLTRQGPPGSNWAVDSFFDVFYEIEFIGRPGGQLSGMSGSTTGTIRMGTGTDWACCLPPPGPACVELSPRDCCAQGGLPQVGRTCSFVNVCSTVNADSPRPCCTASGGCFTAPPSQCCASGGTPGTPGTTCPSAPCPPPVNHPPCCLPDGSCVHMAATSCTAQGGTPNSGTCGVNVTCPQPTWACCFPLTGNCLDLPPAQCTAQGGNPVIGDTCATISCIQPEVGACCNPNFDPECTITTQTGCNGAWHGPGTDCSDNNGDGRPDICVPVTCGPGTAPNGCNNGVCPAPTTCTSKCARINPFNGTVTVTDCDCLTPNDCHVELHGGPNPTRGPGNPCVVNDAGGTVSLPPDGCEYLSPDEVHMIVAGLDPGTTIELAPIHKSFICGTGGHKGICSFVPPPGFCEQPGGTMAGYEDCAMSTLELDLNGTGGLSGFSRNIVMAGVQFEVHSGPRTPGNPVQSFDTQMMRLNGQIIGDPDFDLLRITGGTDFGYPSPGHTTLTQLPGGQWSVDSFFDVCYEIEFVGSATSAYPGIRNHAGTTQGCIRMQAGSGAGCVGACPAGTTCTETRIVNAAGQIDVCCNCDPIQQECAPLSDGSACAGLCTGDGDECQPKCVVVNAFTGEVRIIDCECGEIDDCHLVGTTTTEGGGGGDSRGTPDNPCVVNDAGGTVMLPPVGCEYLSPDEVHMIVDGLDPGTTIELAPIHKNFICSGPAGGTQGVCSFVPPPGFCEQPGGTMAGHQDCAPSTLELDMNGTGGLLGFSRNVQIPVSFEVHTGPRTPGNPIQSFDTQMMRLQGLLPAGDPDFDLLRITGGTDFGMPSPGHTTLTQLPGGQWAVDSFFDITYRIDFVGSNTSTYPGIRNHSGSTTATIRMQTGGVPGRCIGNCPPGTICNETRTVNAAGQITVCCSCDPVCGPTPAGDACAPTTCPIANDRCVPQCMNWNPATGVTRVIDCECQNPNECHVRAGAPGDADPTRGAGNPCDVVDNGGGTVTLPPAGCEYLSPDEVHMILDGLPAGTTIEFATIHKDFICNPQDGTPGGVCSFPPPVPGVDCDEPGGSLGGEKECSDSKLELDASGTGALAGFARMITVPISFEVHAAPRVPGQPIQSFDTDMFRLFGQITNPASGDPDFDLLRIVGGTNFGLPSPGHTTLTRQGPPGSNWAVDSFFDITYRIDFIGRPGGQLSGMSGSTTGTIRMGTGLGGPPQCTGPCPTGTVCVQTVTTSPDGTINVCCDCAPVQTGACCLKNTAAACGCADLTVEQCESAGGLFQGVGSDCATDGERCATGACCYPNGTCTNVDQPDCRGFVCNVADYCPLAVQCYADADCNGVVNAGDRGVISANIGQTLPERICRWDLDGNGVINAGDRGIVSANIGLCTPLPNYQNGSGLNAAGTGPDPRFPQPTFLGCGTNCASTICP